MNVPFPFRYSYIHFLVNFSEIHDALGGTKYHVQKHQTNRIEKSRQNRKKVEKEIARNRKEVS